MEKRKYILIVDDEILGAVGLAETIKDWGFYHCELAGSFERALAEVKRCRPDLILMDINLGYGKKDGIETAQAILADYKVPFIFITGYDIDELQLKDIETPYTFMRKPCDIKILKSSIESLLAKGD